MPPSEPGVALSRLAGGRPWTLPGDAFGQCGASGPVGMVHRRHGACRDQRYPHQLSLSGGRHPRPRDSTHPWALRRTRGQPSGVTAAPGGPAGLDLSPRRTAGPGPVGGLRQWRSLKPHPGRHRLPGHLLPAPFGAGIDRTVRLPAVHPLLVAFQLCSCPGDRFAVAFGWRFPAAGGSPFGP